MTACCCRSKNDWRLRIVYRSGEQEEWGAPSDLTFPIHFGDNEAFTYETPDGFHAFVALSEVRSLRLYNASSAAA
jgi:hypothetical protein